MPPETLIGPWGELTDKNVHNHDTRYYEQFIIDQMIQGRGDMFMDVYDPDRNHIVENSANALKLNGISADEFIKKDTVIDCGTF